MWNSAKNEYWTGTTDLTTINTSVMPIDPQTFSVMSLKNPSYYSVLSGVESNMKVGSGYDYSDNLAGVWYEGTAQMALAYLLSDNQNMANTVYNFLYSSRNTDGSFYATNVSSLYTGFVGQYYYQRKHIAPTAWYILRQNSVNPFWYSSR